MNIYPILLDSRPAFAGASAAPSSLLLLPVGEGTLLGHIRSRLQSITPHAPAVFADIDTPAYPELVRALEPDIGSVVGRADFRARLDAYEPSDWLLVVDPSCLPAAGFSAASLFSEGMDPRWVRHLVALERSVDGTRECVEIDSRGRVRRIRRFYDAVTWPFTEGVCCSLMPASCALLGEDLPWTSLAEMKHALSRRGIPSHDLPMQEEVVNLGVEEDMLAFSEYFIRESTAAARRGSPSTVLYVGGQHQVDRTARLVGPVILQRGAVVEAGATVLGPALIGRGARVGRGALVAQSVLAAGAVVVPEATVRHRVLVGAMAPAPAVPLVAAVHAPRVVAGPRPAPRGRDRRAERERRGEERREDWRYGSWKPWVEGAAAALALLLLSPLLLLIALAVRLDSAGPVFFGHKREGRHGRLFRCWKFRTMRLGADAGERELRAQSQVDGPQFKITSDPRITRVGHFLRATNLDELPQLLNVALGQMSLVGPRPSPFRENQTCVPWREGRLSVRPGITGLWQVCRHERSEGDFHQWIHYDLLYVRHTSLAVDMKILLATLLTGGGKAHVPLSWILSAEGLGKQPSPTATPLPPATSGSSLPRRL